MTEPSTPTRRDANRPVPDRRPNRPLGLGGTVPWPRQRVTEDPYDTDIDRAMVFVPAIMSVGLIFSIATLVRDLFHWTGGRARERRTAIDAGAVVSRLVGEPEPDPADIGILSRPLYLITAIVLAGGAVYVTIGSIANFARDQGYVRDIGWLLAISLALALVLGFLGGVALTVFLSWPHPPAWTFEPLRTAPLSVTPGRRGIGPSWSLSASTLAAAIVTFILTLIVGSGRSVAMDIDRPIADWLIEANWLERLAVIDPFGGTLISVGFVTLIGLSAFRCRIMAVVYPLAFLLAWGIGGAIREVVERPRPTRFGDLESFPSGHMVQAVFIAGLVPLALSVLVADRRLTVLSRIVLALAAIATGLHRVHNQDHWPLDILAGAGLGITVVLGAHWVIAHRGLHHRCSSCPWSPHPGSMPWRRGVFTLSQPMAEGFGALGALGGVAAAGVLVLATVWIGLPTDPIGFGFNSEVSGPVQIGLAVFMALSGMVAFRWPAVGAVGIALAATGLGLFASIQYQPVITVTLTAMLLIPAVMLWLSWQRTETIGRIASLASVTAALLTLTAVGSGEIYNHYFGPTHIDSDAEGLDSEEADWLWVGAVSAESATIVAGGLEVGDPFELRYWPIDGSGEAAGPSNVVAADSGPFGTASFVLEDLEPESRYRYAVDELGETEATGAGDAAFTTFDDGPQDLVVIVGACARSGSNGAVFDAIVAEEPDLYLSLGDMHYANLASTDPLDHVGEYGRALTQPGQAALYSSTPVAYVWDDHDYGPNDSDASSISRLAVSTAYREAVPNYGVDPDTTSHIGHSFTVGRVGFVMTDTRSQRTDDELLGADQRAWLIDELIRASRTNAIVVWANPTPWIGEESASSDSWWGYPAERQMIADAIAAAGVDNLVMVSGDAHMVAIDDGTNSGYAADGSPGFPVLNAAALDRPGSVKGGPFTHGVFPGSGQYGKLTIEDDGGDTVTVRLSGHSWRDQLELTALEVTFDVGG